MSSGSKEVRTICEFISEFAPPGTKKLTNGLCHNLTGNGKVEVYRDKDVTCVKETDLLGSQKYYCHKTQGDS
jgi:hypothetical protein